jgi:hypothetical protein
MRFRQLALRDLFWLALVTACLVSWGLDHQRAARRIEELELEAKWHDNGGHGSISGFAVNISCSFEPEPADDSDGSPSDQPQDVERCP